MIDAETVLTAGHCVFDGVHVPFGGCTERYGWAEEIWVYPGHDGTGESLGWTPVLPASVGAYGRAFSIDFTTSIGWADGSDPDYELALVGVTRGVGMLTGWFGLTHGRDCAWHASMLYHNASYPDPDPPPLWSPGTG